MRYAFGRAKLLYLAALLSALAFSSHAGAAQLSDDDKRTVAELALQWAVDGGIPDVNLLPDPSKLTVSGLNLPPHLALHIANRTVAVQSPTHIQARADVEGDLLYFRLGPFSSENGHAVVPIALMWASGVRSKTPHLSGGGTTLQFERRGGKWRLLPVTERWTS